MEIDVSDLFSLQSDKPVSRSHNRSHGLQEPRSLEGPARASQCWVRPEPVQSQSMVRQEPVPGPRLVVVCVFVSVSVSVSVPLYIYIRHGKSHS